MVNRSHTDSDIYLTPGALPTVLGTLESLGAVLTGKFKDYVDQQKGIVPYMTKDIMCVLCFMLLPPVQFSSYANTNKPRDVVTIDVDRSVIHLKTGSGQYVLYMPALQSSGTHPKVDVIVTHYHSGVIKQFDFQNCSSYFDMTNDRLV